MKYFLKSENVFFIVYVANLISECPVLQIASYTTEKLPCFTVGWNQSKELSCSDDHQTHMHPFSGKGGLYTDASWSAKTASKFLDCNQSLILRPTPDWPTIHLLWEFNYFQILILYQNTIAIAKLYWNLEESIISTNAKIQWEVS